MEGEDPSSPTVAAASALPLATKLPPKSTGSSPSAGTSRSSSAGSTVTLESNESDSLLMLGTPASPTEEGEFGKNFDKGVGADSGGGGEGRNSRSSDSDDSAYSSDGDGTFTDDASDECFDGNAAHSTQPSTLRLSVSDEAMGIFVDAKTNMKLDKYDYRKSKDGKEGNALRAHNPIMRIMPSPVPGRMGTATITYPPYIGKAREEEPGAEDLPTSGLYFKIGPKVHEYNCVRNSWLRAGFVRTNSWSKCAGYWGRHCSATTFRNLNRWQKVNHFPGSWVLGRKDRLGRIMGRMRRMHGTDYNIHAETMVMPMDRRKLVNLISSEPRALWIIKPASSSCGRGIRVVSSQTINPKKLRKGTIVQRYLSKPYLIDGRKFDMRIYIVVTCYDPLRAYICEEGLVRFATGKYSRSLKSLKNRFVHLTNYSVNKNSDEFVKPTSNAAGNGVEQTQAASKWTLTHLLKYFRENGIDDGKVLADIKDCCVKTLISAETHIASLVHQLGLARTNCFEVFGFDVFLDHKLKPWLIEVNVSPSLSSSSPLDKRIKNKLLCDTFHTVGFKPYDHRAEGRLAEQTNTERLHHGTSRGSRPNTSSRSSSRKFSSRNVLQLKTPGKLSKLSEQDMDLLLEMEEEFSRKGDLTRIYPSDDPEMNAYYSQFFECARYNNTLVNMWIKARGLNSLTRSGGAGRPAPPKAPAQQRQSRTSSRPRRSGSSNVHDYRPSLVERQGLSRSRYQQNHEQNHLRQGQGPGRREEAAKARIAGFEVMRKDLQEEQERRDQAWDRDWDRAHGHDVSESDDEDSHREGTRSMVSRIQRSSNDDSAGVTRVAPAGVNSKSGHISRLQQRRLEIEKIARDHENAELKKNNVANPANVSNEVGQILTPRAQMAHAILENARSDFAAIQEAMRAVAGQRGTEVDSTLGQVSKFGLQSGSGRENRADIKMQSRRTASANQPHRHPRSQSRPLQHSKELQDGYYDQRFARGQRVHRKQKYPPKQRLSPRSDGSINPYTEPPSTFTALAPGRDAVLAYQQRQYRKQQQGRQQRSKLYQRGSQNKQPARPHRSRRVGVEELAAEVRLSGMSMPLQRHSSFGSEQNGSHAAWVQGRRPRYR